MLGWRRRSWAWPRELRLSGILGLNRRNADYVLAHNPRCYFPRVDDKLLTKRICEARGIPVPQTYAAIQRHGDILRLPELVAAHTQFVVKPAHGSGGRGIIVIAEHNGDRFVTSGGEPLRLADLCYHLSTILSGFFSLGEQPDRALVEQRILRHPVFENLSVDGTPDLRIIVYRQVPVMAMVRLPTCASRGLANLHQGAIAAGVNLATGCTLGGVCRNRAVSEHPDTGAAIAGVHIPFWSDLLLAAVTDLAEALEMGYLGVDFVLDAGRGPVMLEANARPGLAIQVANRRGLLPRLRLVDGLSSEELTPDRRAELLARLAASD